MHIYICTYIHVHMGVSRSWGLLGMYRDCKGIMGSLSASSFTSARPSPRFKAALFDP